MMVSDHHKTVSAPSRLSLASIYLLLVLMTGSYLLHADSGYLGFAAAVVDSGLMPPGIEEDQDALLPAFVVCEPSLFAAPVVQQQTDSRRQRHSFSIRLIRAPPGVFS